jgi:peptide/nickel transport system substrate-binding protein
VLRYNTNHPVLSDVRLRQAMNHAIDRQLLIDTLWGGKAVALRGHQFEEYGDLYNAERPFTPYDPELARQLVEESDYDGSVIEYATDANYSPMACKRVKRLLRCGGRLGLMPKFA